MAVLIKKGTVLEEEGLNITPLIDCVFLLLIFFMVTTVFKNPAKLIMELPIANNPLKIEERHIIVELDENDIIALNGEVVPLETFDAYLIIQKKITGSSTLLIKADVVAKHGTVLKLMKMAKDVGIETIGMAVDTETEE